MSYHNKNSEIIIIKVYINIFHHLIIIIYFINNIYLTLKQMIKFIKKKSKNS